MAAPTTVSTTPPPSVPTIREAIAPLGQYGRVFKGTVIDKNTAIARRKAGLDIVVCGDDKDANRQLAKEIEAAAVGTGNYRRHDPHPLSAGPDALPHYQPKVRPPDGHSFYETARLKARKKP